MGLILCEGRGANHSNVVINYSKARVSPINYTIAAPTVKLASSSAELFGLPEIHLLHVLSMDKASSVEDTKDAIQVNQKALGYNTPPFRTLTPKLRQCYHITETIRGIQPHLSLDVV